MAAAPRRVSFRELTLMESMRYAAQKLSAKLVRSRRTATSIVAIFHDALNVDSCCRYVRETFSDAFPPH